MPLQAETGCDNEPVLNQLFSWIRRQMKKGTDLATTKFLAPARSTQIPIMIQAGVGQWPAFLQEAFCQLEIWVEIFEIVLPNVWRLCLTLSIPVLSISEM